MYNISTLKPLVGDMPDSFSDCVSMVTRPYIEIDEKSNSVLVNGEYDFYLMEDNSVVTFGNADNGYALMPLMEEYANEILKENNIVVIKKLILF